ncbi:MAG: glycosyltransferase [Pelobium sp.]
MKGISVIICCFNSANRIEQTLKYLLEQQIQDIINWEVILVNNNSNDDTIQISTKFIRNSKVKIDFKIINEPNPGLNYARQAGFKKAQYEYLLMVDDDNWLNNHYLETVYKIMNQNLEIGILGGYGIEKCEVTPPEWFEHYKLSYAVGKHAQLSGDITSTRGDVYGAGATIRKAAFQKLIDLGFETIMTDRSGIQLTSGGDNEICIALKTIGYQIWCDNRLKFNHFIPKERLTENYIIKLNIAISSSFCLLRPYYYLLNQENFNLRPNYKKNWIWIILPRVLHFTFSMSWIHILKYKLTHQFNTKVVDAYSRLSYLRTILKEKNNDLKNYYYISSKDWSK